ncbi:sensor histidine kinase [Dongia sp.]|uniref:sensor histidine kinase n=1 Tax=Dongia sp. TaxID=1977262 RepID=UPI0035B41D02
MKHRLFWKILIGFWITFIVMMEGLWISFALYDEATSPLWDYEADGRIKLDALTAVLQTAGPGRLDAIVNAWPDDHRQLFSIRPMETTASGVSGGISRSGDLLSTATRDPAGSAWILSYDLGPARQELEGTSLFELPPDLLATGAVGGLLFSAALAWYLARPIQSLQSGFRRFAEGKLGTRLQPEMGSRRDEIADLARDFDQMAARLQQLVAARDQLLHDVSHELRSPLARLQVAIDLARQNPDRLHATLERVDAESRRLDELVGELLTLSRVESGVPAFDDYFDLGELLRKIVEDARFEAQASQVSIVANLAETEPAVRGNAELMRRALENIIRNSLRHSTAGEAISVDLICDRKEEVFEVRVADRGPGVPAEALERMFEPFVRLANCAPHSVASGGFGLGLAIARRAVMAHGGTIRAENRLPQGLCVVVRLPFDKEK